MVLRMSKCEHTKFIKEKGSYYYVCDNGFCFLTVEEFDRDLR
jgi:hypothetical protein